MGVVYRAWDTRMERWVALKTIQPDKATRAQFMRRFKQEATSAGRLSHPNIVTIYEFDEQEDVCYIAMQFLEGTDLESLLMSRDFETEFNNFRKLDILVLADPDSRSGKSKLADDLGVRKIAEPVFWRTLGVAID